VVCVHNALPDVQNCLNSILATDYAGPWSLIVIDDGSAAETRDWLQTFTATEPRATLIRRDQAGGYTIAANTGLRASTAGFTALLNSDTIVPARWLTKITALFAARPDVGIVGPLSNAASWQSVPELSAPEGGWSVNPLPEGWDVERMDTLVEAASAHLPTPPRVPLLNGFCFTVRAAMLDDIGLLDEQGFPRGYGEEDDLCMRAALAGWGLSVATDTYVFHAKSKSYGAKTRSELSARGQVELKRKHTEARLARSVATMRHNPLLAEMRERVAELMP